MITDSEKRDLVYKTFLINASQRLEEIERNLHHFKDDPSADRINHLVQLTYGLRGTAESLEFPTVSVVAHLLEENLKKLLNPLVVVDSELESLLFQGYECLKLPLQVKLTRTPLDEPEILKWIITIFAQLHLKLESFGDRRQISYFEENIGEIADSCLPRTDVTQAIFETWIGKRLANLALTLTHADKETVAAYLREQCRVFIDLSTQLNLKGFGDIAKTAIAALDLHPEQSITIAQIALADFLSGQILILSGDRTHGGRPSEKLKQFTDREHQSAQTPQLPGFVAGQERMNLQSPTENALNAMIHISDQRLTVVSELVSELLTSLTQQTLVHRKIQHYAQGFQKKLLQFQTTLIPPQPVSSTSPLSPSRSIAAELEYLTHFSQNLLGFHLQAEQPLQQQQQHLEQIQQHLIELRTLPIDDLFNRLPLFIEKWAKAAGKQIEVHYQSHQVRINKGLSGKLNHLILSLIYTALIQGIEDPDMRRRLGKTQKGRIKIEADQQQDSLVITIGHDGQGLNFEQIRKQSIQLHLQSPEQAARLSKQQLLDLLLQTKSHSHRWNYSRIGLGARFKHLQAQLNELQGAFTIHSQANHGTAFTMTLPNQQRALCDAQPDDPAMSSLRKSRLENAETPSLPSKMTHLTRAERLATRPGKSSPGLSTHTLKTDNFFIWLSNSVVFALPYSNIVECVMPRRDHTTPSKPQFLPWHGQMLPFYRLSELLRSSCKLPKTLAKDKNDSVLTLVIRQDLQLFAVESAIQKLLTKPEITISPFRDVLELPGFVRGCTVLDDSHIAFVVDVTTLMQHTLETKF